MVKTKKRLGVFIDRDGTINALTSHPLSELVHEKELRLLPGVGLAIKNINQLGLLVFIHTNQPVVARGHLSEKKLHLIHEVLQKRLRRQGAHIDAIYYCPHHPRGRIKKYQILCQCRKPGIGAILEATRAFDLDIKNSFLIGDSTRDIASGERAGLKTILVKTGNAGQDRLHSVHPDAIVKDLLSATRWIKKELTPRESG